MKKLKKLGALLLSLICVASMAACNGNNPSKNTENSSPEKEKIDISKEVKLKIYGIGDNGGAYADEALQKANEYMKEKINATLEPAMISWADYKSKIPAILASGEDFDMIYTASWAFFHSEGGKGAFRELDDLLQTYAPKTYEEYSQAIWDQAKIKDKIYMFPAVTDDFATYGVVIRSDLRKKYNVPEVTDMDSLGVYLQAIKDNEKGMVPLNSTATSIPVNIMCYMNDWNGVSVGNEVVFNGEEFIQITKTPEYEEFLDRQHEWYKKGYWSKNILANKTACREEFKAGNSAASFENLGNANALYRAVKTMNETQNLGWEVEYCLLEDNSKAMRVPYINNGTAVNRNAPNPERSVMFLELLNQDETLYDLLCYGLEGTHYVKTSDGKLDVPKGSDPAELALYGISMGFNNKKFAKDNVNDWDVFLKTKEDCIANAMDPLVLALNNDSITAEVAAVTNVCNQYKLPMDWGVVSKEEGLKELQAQLENAGIDKILEEYNRQYKESLK